MPDLVHLVQPRPYLVQTTPFRYLVHSSNLVYRTSERVSEQTNQTNHHQTSSSSNPQRTQQPRKEPGLPARRLPRHPRPQREGTRMTTLTICTEPGCPMIATHRGRCQQHSRMIRAARTNTADSPEHRATRARLLPLAYNTPCPLCGELMLEGQTLDLDHTIPLATNPRSHGDRITHAHCNRSAGGRLAHGADVTRAGGPKQPPPIGVVEGCTTSARIRENRVPR